MNKRLKDISENYQLEYYTNEKNIPNQDLVKETIGYFEKGGGARAFKPLEFLNLLEKQYWFVLTNYNNEDLVIAELKNLPLRQLEKHILFGLILKWFGGYPVNNLNEDFNKTLKIIQTEFLNLKGETPEKEFCKADNERRKEFIKYGIAFTAAINNNVSVEDILNAMPDHKPKIKVYSTFNDVFEDAVRTGIVEEIENRDFFVIAQSKYEYKFKCWLLEHKGWEYGNESEYHSFLTQDNFIEFLNVKSEKLEKENETPSEIRISVMDIDRYPKDYTLNSNYKAILNKCMNASYERNRLVAVDLIRSLIERHPTKKELLIKDFCFDIQHRIDEFVRDYPENAIFTRKVEGAGYLLQWLKNGMGEYNESIIKASPLQENETKTNKLKAPVLGLLCGLINKIGIDKREETESANIYCERICVKYKLPYTDRVRQNYNVNETKKLIQELTEKVLPLIDTETKNLIQKYLDSKQPTKPNLYA